MLSARKSLERNETTFYYQTVYKKKPVTEIHRLQVKPNYEMSMFISSPKKTILSWTFHWRSFIIFINLRTVILT